MKNVFVTIFLVFFLNLGQAQYISEIIEYIPAPGQVINTSPWGMPESANSIIGGINGTLNLGAFGGYVVFKFENSVENNPDNPYGVDFTIFGNPLPDWSEPAVVFVMQDANNNGLADDTWYELAGSDYYFSSSTNNYEVTYTNPGGNEANNVFWQDNQGNTDYIYANDFHIQNYYPSNNNFPNIDENNYTLSGSYIIGGVDKSNSANVKSFKRDFGYADNQFRGVEPYTLPDNPYTQEVENSGGDAFDISWAINENNNYIELEYIDFVKVQNAMQDNAGWLGEISPEITGAVDVAPNKDILGENIIITIKDLPKYINTTQFQLEAFVFENGRIQPEKTIHWETNNSDFYVDDVNILHCNIEGELELTAVLDNDNNITKTVFSTVNFSVANEEFSEKFVQIYPNPATNFFKINDNKRKIERIDVVDLSGKKQISIENYTNNSNIDISNLKSGIYFVNIFSEDYVKTEKLTIF